MIKIGCQILGDKSIKFVEVSLNDPVNILIEKLNISEDIAKFCEFKFCGSDGL